MVRPEYTSSSKPLRDASARNESHGWSVCKGAAVVGLDSCAAKGSRSIASSAVADAFADGDDVAARAEASEDGATAEGANVTILEAGGVAASAISAAATEVGAVGRSEADDRATLAASWPST